MNEYQTPGITRVSYFRLYLACEAHQVVWLTSKTLRSRSLFQGAVLSPPSLQSPHNCEINDMNDDSSTHYLLDLQHHETSN